MAVYQLILMALFAGDLSVRVGAQYHGYSVNTETKCTEVTNEPPQWNGRWAEGLSMNTDQELKGGEIVAYKIHWFTGSWSQWFVPGVNDIDLKYNTENNSLRRYWGCFNDHYHTYIICKDSEPTTADDGNPAVGHEGVQQHVATVNGGE